MMNELTIPAGATGADVPDVTDRDESAAILVEMLQLIAELHNRIKALEAR